MPLKYSLYYIGVPFNCLHGFHFDADLIETGKTVTLSGISLKTGSVISAGCSRGVAVLFGQSFSNSKIRIHDKCVVWLYSNVKI